VEGEGLKGDNPIFKGETVRGKKQEVPLKKNIRANVESRGLDRGGMEKRPLVGVSTAEVGRIKEKEGARNCGREKGISWCKCLGGLILEEGWASEFTARGRGEGKVVLGGKHK